MNGHLKNHHVLMRNWTPIIRIGGIVLSVLGLFLLIFNMREALQLRELVEVWPKALQMVNAGHGTSNQLSRLAANNLSLAAADQTASSSTETSVTLSSTGFDVEVYNNYSTSATNNSDHATLDILTAHDVESRDSSNESSQILGTNIISPMNISSGKWRRISYRVCVVIVRGCVGRDYGATSDQHGFSSPINKRRPANYGMRSGTTSAQILPYTELYRLFQAAKKLSAAAAAEEEEDLAQSQQKSKSSIITAPGVLRRSSSSSREYLVATDSPAIVCKMTRDSLGNSASCLNWSDVAGPDHQNLINSTTTSLHQYYYCNSLVVGSSQRYASSGGQQLRFPPARGDAPLQWERLELVDLDELEVAREPPSLPEAEWRPTIVTGFSSNHLEVGLLLLRSLGRAAAEQRKYANLSAVVWTMDSFPPAARKALACVVSELASRFGVAAEVRRFDFDAWPQWMRIQQRKGYMGGTGEYAWKAVMVHTVLQERGFVLWTDAGRRFRSAVSLTNTLDYIKLKGFASGVSSGRLRDWTHAKQLEFLTGTPVTSNSFLKRPNCDASAIGCTLKRYTTASK